MSEIRMALSPLIIASYRVVIFILMTKIPQLNCIVYVRELKCDNQLLFANKRVDVLDDSKNSKITLNIMHGMDKKCKGTAEKTA